MKKVRKNLQIAPKSLTFADTYNMLKHYSYLQLINYQVITPPRLSILRGLREG